MDQHKAPLFEKMLELARTDPVRWHVPGHKGKKLLSPETDVYFDPILKLDWTELPGLDDLHRPEGVIAEAQALAADRFGADRTFFLVGGSTVGNLALITALCGQGELLIVQRNSHKSVLGGLKLAGARAVFLSPEWDGKRGMAAGVRPGDVEEALRRHPKAKGVYLTNPNYYGTGIDLRPFAECTGRYGIPLIVDEAHGAHYGLHPGLPESALAQGADAVVQSTHKGLTAMTMGAMLHLKGNRVDAVRVGEQLALLQSSSPSYPIMASLDLARRRVAVRGEALFDLALDTVRHWDFSIRRMPWFGSIHGTNADGYGTVDPLKVLLRDRTGTLDGFALRRELQLRGCFPEMADPRQVLLMFGPGTDRSDTDRLLAALADISTGFALEKQELSGRDTNILNTAEPYGPLTISGPVAFGSHPVPTVAVPLEEAANRRSGEMVIPYPPGIPLLYPGEMITGDMIRMLRRLADAGTGFQGVQDGTLHSIRIAAIDEGSE